MGSLFSSATASPVTEYPIDEQWTMREARTGRGVLLLGMSQRGKTWLSAGFLAHARPRLDLSNVKYGEDIEARTPAAVIRMNPLYESVHYDGSKLRGDVAWIDTEGFDRGVRVGDQDRHDALHPGAFTYALMAALEDSVVILVTDVWLVHDQLLLQAIAAVLPKSNHIIVVHSRSTGRSMEAIRADICSVKREEHRPTWNGEMMQSTINGRTLPIDHFILLEDGARATENEINQQTRNSILERIMHLSRPDRSLHGYLARAKQQYDDVRRKGIYSFSDIIYRRLTPDEIARKRPMLMSPDQHKHFCTELQNLEKLGPDPGSWVRHVRVLQVQLPGTWKLEVRLKLTDPRSFQVQSEHFIRLSCLAPEHSKCTKVRWLPDTVLSMVEEPFQLDGLSFFLLTVDAS